MSNPCPYESQDTAGRYVAGRLAGPEREAFEQHYFACDACFEEVTEGAGIRAALGSHHAARRTWKPWYAAAAALLLAALALPFLTDRSVSPPADAPVWRSTAGSALPLHLTTENDQWTFRWDEHPETVEYQVELFSQDGALLLRHATGDTQLTVDRGAIPPGEEQHPIYARLRAYGAAGTLLHSSDLQRIEPHDSPQ